MGILDPLRRTTSLAPVEARYSWQDYVNDVMTFGGWQYRLGMAGSKPDVPTQGFEDYIERIHNRTGVVSAAVEQRARLLSQIVPKWRRQTDNELFGNRDLLALERPGGETRQQFFYRLEVDASYAGSAYVVNDGGRVRRLRPDKCSVVLGSNSDPTWDAESQMHVPYDAEVTALLYHPGVGADGWQVFMPDEFVIWSPEPDPVNFWRGISWVSSVVREVVADGQATDHQSKFFEHAGTPNLVFIMNPDKTPEETREFAAITNKLHSGAQNAYKNMFLGGGTDVKVVGSTLESLSLKDITGGFENRVAIRSRIPAVILGTREGLSGSSLNAGNYNSARRMLADGWFSPYADGMMASLERILRVPTGAYLSWDREAVLFLQEDAQQGADILSTKAATMRTLIDGGFDPASVVEAISKGKLERLVHSGKLSVQLQPPGNGTPNAGENAAVVDAEARHTERPEQMRLELHNHTHVTRSDVTVEPAQVTVEGADVRVEPQIEVHVPEQRMDAPQVTVNVEPTPVNITNDVQPAPVEVKNQVNVDTPPAQVTVVGDDRKSRFRVKRDGQGRIAEVNED